jgi:hypothetical protein
MTIGIITALAAALVIAVSWKYFFSTKNNLEDPCEKLRQNAVKAGERYEKWRRLVIEQINERNQLKAELAELAQKKKKCEKEYKKLKDAFNEGGVTIAGENDEAWWEERKRLREELRAKEKACKKLVEEWEKKRQRLRELEGALKQGRLMEELSRESYPEAWERYRECEKRQKEKEETPTTSEQAPCCPSGFWVGIVAREGGSLFLPGLESGVIYILCLDNPDVSATLKWRGIRVGPALGGGAGVELILLSGPQFPCKTEDAVSDVISGLGFDLSAGPALADYLEGIAKSGGKLAKLLEDSAGAAAKFEKLKNALKGSDSALKDGIKTRLSAGGMSAGTSGFTGVTIPLAGLGVNVGLWWTIPETCELVSWSGCPPCDE